MEVKRAHDVVTLLASAARTDTAGTTSDAVRLPGIVHGMTFLLDVTAAATAVGDTLDVTIQTNVGGTWVEVAYFTQILGDGGAKVAIAKLSATEPTTAFVTSTALTAGNVRHILGDEWRVKWVIVDAGADNASFTFSVSACPM